MGEQIANKGTSFNLKERKGDTHYEEGYMRKDTELPFSGV